MKHLKLGLGLTVLSVLSATAANSPAPALIPAPAHLETHGGTFQIDKSTVILADAASRDTATMLAATLRTATGYPLPVRTTDNATPSTHSILLTTEGADAQLGREGYALDVTAQAAVIRATDQAGLFYGAQTLRQLLPPEVFATHRVSGVAWTMPGVTITDQPRFPWRGLMLDVSRHFFTKPEIKRLLDEMALHKINTFHWHLVDDQGWRIEIKKYPRLTQEAAWRADVGFGFPHDATTAYGPDGRYGGFYTQDDIREIVAYAAARHITIVPEIEMPGHSTAALSVFPELSCAGEASGVPTNGGVMHGIYCAGNDASFTFLQNVLTEVFQLFPGQYIHIGGDEVPKDNWKKCPRCQARIKAEGLKNEHELQSWFIRRVEKFINAHGKNLIGWSEIREGGLAQNAAVMDWIGGGLEAAREGHDVVMTPTSFCYFDYYQSRDHGAEPRAIGGYLPLSKVYSFEPVPAGLEAAQVHHILGGQGNIWTEYIPNFKQVEYMAFPRLCAMAEVTWSPQAARNWTDFTNRLATDEQRLDQLGVNYRRDTSVAVGEWTPAQIKTENTTLSWDVTPHVTAAGQYRVTLNYTTGQHGIDIAAVKLLADGQEVAHDTHAGFAGGQPRSPLYVLDLPARNPDAHYTLQATVKGSGGTDSQGAVSWVFKPAK
jgi:hexosaminidase